MRNTILTVSVAAYNVEEYIEECLLPFTEAGIFDRCEVLIIDDGATDNTALIASKIEHEFPNTFKVIKKKNGGWGSTVNCVIELAQGYYFKQLDGDDYYDADGLRSFLDFLETADSDVVLSKFSTFISGTKDEIQIDDPAKRFGMECFKEYSLADLRQDENVAMHNCTFKTSVLRENSIRLLEKSFYTDVELVVKALCHSSTVSFTPFKVYCYRVQRAGQSTNIEGARKHYKEHKNVLFRSAAYIRNHSEAGCYAMVINRMKHMAYTQYSLFFFLEPSVQHYRETKEFDKELKRSFPELYQQESRCVNFLRTTMYLGYFPISVRNCRRARKDTTLSPFW